MMLSEVATEQIFGLCFFGVFIAGESHLELLSHWLIPEYDNAGHSNSEIA